MGRIGHKLFPGLKGFTCAVIQHNLYLKMLSKMKMMQNLKRQNVLSLYLTYLPPILTKLLRKRSTNQFINMAEVIQLLCITGIQRKNKNTGQGKLQEDKNKDNFKHPVRLPCLPRALNINGSRRPLSNTLNCTVAGMLLDVKYCIKKNK